MQVTAIPPRKIKLGYDAKVIYILHKYQPLDLQGLRDCLNKEFQVEHSVKSLQYDQLTFLTERGIVKELKKGNEKLYVLSDYLPFKALVWKDKEDHVLVSYNSVVYLTNRYNLTDDLAKNIAGIDTLIQNALTA